MKLFTLPLINANRQGVTPGRVGLPDKGIKVYKGRSEIKERRSRANAANPGRTQLPRQFSENGASGGLPVTLAEWHRLSDLL